MRHRQGHARKMDRVLVVFRLLLRRHAMLWQGKRGLLQRSDIRRLRESREVHNPFGDGSLERRAFDRDAGLCRVSGRHAGSANREGQQRQQQQ